MATQIITVIQTVIVFFNYNTSFFLFVKIIRHLNRIDNSFLQYNGKIAIFFRKNTLIYN